MKGGTPQEIEVWYVLPAIRCELAKAMLKKGLKQKQIAKLLGITEAAVSQYLKEKRAKEEFFDKKIKQEIKRSADKIIKDNSLVMSEIQRMCNLVKESGILCKLHHKHCNIPKECKVCLKWK